LKPPLYTLTKDEQSILISEAFELADYLSSIKKARTANAAMQDYGIYNAPYAGMGDEFWEFRQAQLGDSLHSIDWRQSAKTHNLYVRQQQKLRTKHVVFWLDMSASMLGDVGHYKMYLLLLITTSFGIFLLKQGYSISVLQNNEHKPRKFAGEHWGKSFFSHLLTLFYQPTSLQINKIPDGAFLICMSDFMFNHNELNTVLEGYKALLIRGICLQVLSDIEMRLPFDGNYIFDDAENRSLLTLHNVEEHRQNYLELLKEHNEKIYTICKNNFWNYIACDPQSITKPEKVLLKLAEHFEQGQSNELKWSGY
jgi:uncharacterized protein (DUF58 family)